MAEPPGSVLCFSGVIMAELLRSVLCFSGIIMAALHGSILCFSGAMAELHGSVLCFSGVMGELHGSVSCFSRVLVVEPIFFLTQSCSGKVAWTTFMFFRSHYNNSMGQLSFFRSNYVRFAYFVSF